MTILPAVLLAMSGAAAAPVGAALGTPDADTVRAVNEVEFFGTHTMRGDHEWRFHWDPATGPATPTVALWAIADDPEYDDRMLTQLALPGLTANGDDIVWTDGNERVVCATVHSDFWSGYAREVRETGLCALLGEQEEAWVETDTGLERRTRMRVRLQSR